MIDFGKIYERKDLYRIPSHGMTCYYCCWTYAKWPIGRPGRRWEFKRDLGKI